MKEDTNDAKAQGTTNEAKGEREVTQPGEPSRTPGSAEGDRDTVEQALREHEKKGE
jgi:hypothetical protein